MKGVGEFSGFSGEGIMRRSDSPKYVIVFTAAFMLAGLCDAVLPDTPSRWDTGTEDWSVVDNWFLPYAADNLDSSLRISFANCSGDTPSIPAGIVIAKADATTSLGRYVGDYKAADVSHVSFRLFCTAALPEKAQLLFHSSLSGNYWCFQLPAATLGEWVWFDVPLEYAAGWTMGPSEAAFNSDIESVDWIGVRIFRNQTEEQAYLIDDFVVASSRYDADGDGMGDLAETRVGTDPHDASSVFKLSMMSSASGITIAWPSQPGFSYDVWRTTDLSAGFLPPALAADVPASLSEPFTTYVDTTALENGPYFYRVTPR